MPTLLSRVKRPPPESLPAELPPRAQDAPDTAADQVRALLGTIPVGFAGSLIPAAVLAWIFRAKIPPAALWTWLGWMVAMHAARFLIWFPARRDPDFPRNARRWLHWLRATIFLLGISWAMLPLTLVSTAPFDELLLAAVIAAVAGASMAQLASDMASALLFVLPSAAAVTLRLFASHDAALQAIGDLAILYFAYLVLAGRRTQAAFLELSRLHTRASTQSLHDALTGLPNRLALNLRLSEAIARARRDGTEVAVGYLDLDDFKQVNDRFGHDAGDALLRAAARQWSLVLRESEVIARLGGDEFVLVIEDIDPARAVTQLTAVFERVRRAVAAPVPVGLQQSVQIVMTMGVARFPVDGTEPDLLLRRADAAMYQLKLQKATRRNWWQLGAHDPPADSPERPIDPYGSEAMAVLAESAPLFAQINAEFVEALYRDLDADAATRALLHHLDDAQFAALKQRQQVYLQRLVDPGTSRDELTRNAHRIGTVHFLGGVTVPTLAQASMRYRALLAERLGATRLAPGRRFRLLAVVESRAQDELQAQFAAGEAISHAYMATFSRPRPMPATLWPDAAQQELDALATLPGVVVVALRRLNRDGALVVERTACAAGTDIPTTLFDGNALPELDPGSPRGLSATSVAWRTQDIARIDSWAGDARVAPWKEAGMRVGVRSHVAIPFSGQDGHVAGVVTLYGGQSNQFASPWMQQWTAGVRRRLESIWGQCSVLPGVPVLAEDMAQRYREQLFAGGLEMYVQPIAHLRTGQVARVEALARLRMPDGTVVSPAVFLPPLGDIELDRVFRIGLDQALDALQAWDARGLGVDMSINLPPSTLLDPDCAHWVEESLRRHAIAPGRLTLELLEAQSTDPMAQTCAVQRLRDVGIRLAMDDLGTGYSSIERLSTFRFDAIKIDQSLIRQIHDRPLQTVTLIGTLVLLGADLGQSVIVEGIEDAAMLEVAAVFEADYVQGYAIAAPMPVAQFADWLGTHAGARGTGPLPLQTFAGALAYHWRYMHLNNGRHPSAADDCPLTRYLETQGQGGTDVDRWHARVHAGGPDAADASARLSEWLADQARGDRAGG